ncbi:MAG: Fic family protein [Candidatus Bathyarchaeia archaeon]
MVWYPSVEDVIKANKRAVRVDRHPHKLRRSVEAIQSLIDSIKDSEPKGFTYQSARFMKQLTVLHAFDGGNHRTAYSIANLFLIENGVEVRAVSPSLSYAFVKGITSKTISEIQQWMEQYMIQT